MNDTKKELLMDLRTLRNSINLEKKIWLNRYTTNCYAYALGLDIPEYRIIDGAYAPGTISRSPIDLTTVTTFTYKELMNNLYMDLESLGIDFQKVSPNASISPDEWKIAVYTSASWGKLEDYHFLRIYGDDGWSHKNGWREMPTHKDDADEIIRNPRWCYLSNRDYRMCLKLKLK